MEKKIFVQAALDQIQDSEESKPVKFRLVAYTGKPMTVCGFDLPVVIDTQGIKLAKSVTCRLEHDHEQTVGHCENVVVKDNAVYADAIISRSNKAAMDVAQSGKNGFPWQCSVGGPVLDLLELREGETLEVNGESVTGPADIVTSMELLEISFVAAGADDATSAVISAKKRVVSDTDRKEKKMENEKIDSVEEIRAAAAAEVERISQINKLDGPGEIKAQAIKEGWTTERAELECLRASRATVPAMKPIEKFGAEREVLECLAMRAMGVSSERIEKRYSEQTLEAAYKNRGMGLQEFISCAAGKRLPNYRNDAAGFIQAAFSTADVGGILSNVANKALQEGYLYAEETWRDICKITSVPDFKTAYRYRLDPDFSFSKVPAGGEIPSGIVEDANYTNKADTYGVLFSIDRQMLINDDLGALTEIPKQIGTAASESIAEAVWSLLLSNPSSFFGSGHANLVTGSQYSLSIAGLEKAYATFMAQCKKNKKPLGAVPAILLVPGGLAMTAELLNNSITLNNGSTSYTGSYNPFVGKFKVVASSYLDNSSISGYSATAYYLLADPNRIPVVEVAFLNGLDRPIIEQAASSFDCLGIQFRGYADYGVALGDWRGAVKMSGA